MATNKHERVDDAYAAAHAEALNLLDQLRQGVEDLPAPGDDKNPIHWGHFGSLKYLCEQLAELKRHVDGMAN